MYFQVAQSQCRVGCGGEGDSSLVGHNNLEVVSCICITTVGVSQTAFLRNIAFNDRGLVPSVVGLGVVLPCVGVENILQMICSVSEPAIELHVINSRLRVGNGEHHGGVFLLSIHAFPCAIDHPVASVIECTYLKIAQAQGCFSIGAQHDSTLLGNIYPIPIHHVGLALVLIAQLSCHRRTALQLNSCCPVIVGLRVGLLCMTGEIACEIVATISEPAVHLQVISTSSHIRHFENHCAVLCLPVHTLSCAIHHSVARFIGFTYLQIAQAKCCFCLGHHRQFAVFRHNNLIPVHDIGLQEAVSQTSLYWCVEIQFRCGIP